MHSNCKRYFEEEEIILLLHHLPYSYKVQYTICTYITQECIYSNKKWLGVCYMYNQLVIAAKETRGGSRVGCLGEG